MRISKTTGYALLAINYIAKNQKKGIILSQIIAEEYDIPLEYLLKILLLLVKANILRSKRGPHGGFSLAQQPNKITMLQVVEAIDGPFAGYLNLDEHAPGSAFAIKSEKAYEKAFTAAKAVLEKTKISSLL